MPAMTMTPPTHRTRMDGRRLAAAALGAVETPSDAYLNGG
jgi:hypothetical protein